jgi:Family of unknown function (DUF6527)
MSNEKLQDMAILRLDKEPYQLDPREYVYWKGVWYARVPYSDQHIRLLANLYKHRVTIDKAGKITVSPSIKVTDGSESWHGFLENGFWREA